MFVSMAEFVQDNAVQFKVTLPGGRSNYDDDGRLQKGADNGPVDFTGVVLALSNDDVQKADNGRYTEFDRKIYTTEPLTMGTVVEYMGEKYTVDRRLPHSEYTDVYMYYAKGKGAGFT